MQERGNARAPTGPSFPWGLLRVQTAGRCPLLPPPQAPFPLQLVSIPAGASWVSFSLHPLPPPPPPPPSHSLPPPTTTTTIPSLRRRRPPPSRPRPTRRPRRSPFLPRVPRTSGGLQPPHCPDAETVVKGLLLPDADLVQSCNYPLLPRRSRQQLVRLNHFDDFSSSRSFITTPHQVTPTTRTSVARRKREWHLGPVPALHESPAKPRRCRPLQLSFGLCRRSLGDHSCVFFGPTWHPRWVADFFVMNRLHSLTTRLSSTLVHTTPDTVSATLVGVC